MNAITVAAIVSVVGMVLFVLLVAFALYIKGRVRASGRIGATSFDIEATEKQAQMRPRGGLSEVRESLPRAAVGAAQVVAHRSDAQRRELGTTSPSRLPLA
jgi:hypothetical protein